MSIVFSLLCLPFLFRHYSAVHPEKHSEYESKKSINSGNKSSSIDSYFKSESDSHSYGSKHPLQVKITDSLVEDLVVGCSLPLSIVENTHFRKFIDNLNSKYVLPSRSHLTSKLIPEVLAAKRDIIAKKMESFRHVAMTMDIWTDRRMHSYIACTAHAFVDGKPQNFLLAFRPIKGSHTGQLIAEELNNIIESHMVRMKLGCIVTDNASNMKKAFQVLSDLQTSLENENANVDVNVMDNEELWNDLSREEQDIVDEAIEQHTTERLACYAHSLQLCIKEGLNQLKSATALLAKCSKLANLTHQSSVFRGLFEAKFGTKRSISKTNATRWNSMYIQLSSIVKLDPAKLADMLKGEHANLIFTQRESAMLKELVDILQPFSEATDLLQGQDYPTIGCVVPSIVSLYKCLTSMTTTVKFHNPLVNALLTALCERFGGLLQNVKILLLDAKNKKNPNFCSTLYLMASALDPNYSLLWLEDHPGTDDVKRSVREHIMGTILLY